jgi:hypothetical protein
MKKCYSIFLYVMAIEKFQYLSSLHLVDSYRNTISKWAVDFRNGNVTLKLARGKKSLASHGPTALAHRA